MAIVCKSAAEIEKMRRSGGIVRQVLNHVRSLVAPGATTMDLERAAEQQIKELGVKPAFKGYYDYPVRALHVDERGNRSRHPL